MSCCIFLGDSLRFVNVNSSGKLESKITPHTDTIKTHDHHHHWHARMGTDSESVVILWMWALHSGLMSIQSRLRQLSGDVRSEMFYYLSKSSSVNWIFCVASRTEDIYRTDMNACFRIFVCVRLQPDTYTAHWSEPIWHRATTTTTTEIRIQCLYACVFIHAHQTITAHIIQIDLHATKTRTSSSSSVGRFRTDENICSVRVWVCML